jgi:hypothetical protein
MGPGSLKCSSASMMSLGSFHERISSLDAGVLPVMCGNTAQVVVACQSEILERMWMETLWWVEVFTSSIP